MAGPAPLFDAMPTGVLPTPVGERPPARPPAARLRAVLIVALLAVGLADLTVLHQAVPVRLPDVAAGTSAQLTGPVTGPELIPPAVLPRESTAATAAAAADVAFVRGYYALLPRDPTAAFRLLGPPARAQSGGFARFSAFFSGIAALSIDPGAAAVAPSTVAVVIRFRRNSGAVTHERYELVVARRPDGSRLLQSYRRT